MGRGVAWVTILASRSEESEQYKFGFDNKTFKDAHCIAKIYTVIFDIATVLFFVPFKDGILLHHKCMYTVKYFFIYEKISRREGRGLYAKQYRPKCFTSPRHSSPQLGV